MTTMLKVVALTISVWSAAALNASALGHLEGCIRVHRLRRPELFPILPGNGSNVTTGAQSFSYSSQPS